MRRRGKESGRIVLHSDGALVRTPLRVLREELNVPPCKPPRLHAVLYDVPDAHGILHGKGPCHDVVPVEVGVQNPAADRVAGEADEEVEERRPVADGNVPGAAPCALQLLGKVERVVIPLLVGEPGIGIQILRGEDSLFRKRVGGTEKDVGRGLKQKVKGESMVPELPCHHRLVEVVAVEDADLALKGGDILQNLVGSGLPDGEVVLRARVLLK